MRHESTASAVSTADVYSRLRADILSCAMRPGTTFRERQLAERFNVSKTPVRDALIKLQEQNLVEVMPRRGYRVARISLTDARELYEMRLIFERAGISRTIDAAEDRVLEGLDAFRTLRGDITLQGWIEYNRRFHIALVSGCGNARLARTATEVIEQFDRMTYTSVTLAGLARGMNMVSMTDRLREHGAIIDAIQARDRRRAVALSREHIEGSRRRLLSALESASVVP
jgi:GntR family transcriptional regulator, rspAB operon transcriptional repressor